MKRLKSLLLLALVLLCLFVGLWTAQDNSQIVDVYLLGFSFPTMSLGMWLIILFAVGIGFGMLASLPTIARLRSENRRLKRGQ